MNTTASSPSALKRTVNAFRSGWKKLWGSIANVGQAHTERVKEALAESKARPFTIAEATKSGTLHPSEAFKYLVRRSAKAKGLRGSAKRAYRKMMFSNFKMTRSGEVVRKVTSRASNVSFA